MRLLYVIQDCWVDQAATLNLSIKQITFSQQTSIGEIRKPTLGIGFPYKRNFFLKVSQPVSILECSILDVVPYPGLGGNKKPGGGEEGIARTGGHSRFLKCL